MAGGHSADGFHRLIGGGRRRLFGHLFLAQLEVATVPNGQKTNRGVMSPLSPSRNGSELRGKVELARFSGMRTSANARMTHAQIRQHCAIDSTLGRVLQQAMEELHLPARAYDRILKVSRTIADLAGRTRSPPTISSKPISTAASTGTSSTERAMLYSVYEATLVTIPCLFDRVGSDLGRDSGLVRSFLHS